MLKPGKLKPGDMAGICSPSGTMAHKKEMFLQAAANFEKALDLHIDIAPHVFAKHYYSAGTAEERLADFHGLIASSRVKAIVFSGGGDTAIDLVPGLDFDLIAKNPKIIAGISDATTLLSPITARTELVTFLGLEFLDFASHDMAYEIESIQKAWFQGKIGDVHANTDWRDLDNTHTAYCGWQTIREGEARGKLVGGNFQSFIQLVGTKYELPFSGAILFLETYRLPKKQIHKGLMQLKLRGVFEKISGMVVGYCLECDNPDVVGNDQPIAETVLEAVSDYDFPIMQIGEIGHRVENCLQPLGALARMDATNLEFEILEDVAVDL